MLLLFVVLLLLCSTVVNGTEKNDGVPLGMNLCGLASWNPPVFVDVFKQAREWISHQQGKDWGQGPALELDENGWIKRFPSSDCFAETPLLDWAKCMPGGNYTVLYDGDGTIEFSLNTVSVVSKQPGRIVVNYNEGNTDGIWLQIKSTNPENYIRNIRVLMPGTEETYQTQPFYQPHLDLWSSFKVIRFMDWLSTNGNPTVTWAQRTTPQKQTQATANGISWEYVIQYSNMIEADPWICIPHLADDDYVRQCASLLKETLRSESRIYIEYSNEVWNGLFEQARFAQAEGIRLGFAPPERPWEAGAPYYVRRSMEIFRIFEDVFGSVDRLVRVLAWQSGSSVDNLMNYEYHIINGEGIQSLAGKKGFDLADAFATAPYFGGFIGSQLAWVNSHTVEDILIACENDLQEVMNTVDKQVKDAARFGKIFLAYEAGQHLVGIGGNENDQDMTDKFLAANRHPRMKELYLNYLERWKMSGAHTMCIFSSIGNPSKWGSWSIIESYCSDPEQSPKYAAVRDFSEANTPAWWLLPPPEPEPEGDLLINFDASALVSNLTFQRNYQSNGSEDIVSFDVSDAGKLFDGGTNTQAKLYGGFRHIDPASPGRKPELMINTGFTIGMSAGENIYSEATGLLIWRKDQFLKQDDAVKLSKLSVKIDAYTGQARFVVKNKGKYYFSEYLMTSAGEFELTGINNSNLPTKRWLEFHPVTNNFSIPFSVPLMLTGFMPLALDDVTEVGIWITSNRPSWSHTLSFSSFKAYTVFVPEPVNHAVLTDLIAGCRSLLADAIDGGLIGNGNGQYPADAANIFERAITSAQQIDDNIQALQAQIDEAVSALTAAKAIFLASKITIISNNSDLLLSSAVIYPNPVRDYLYVDVEEIPVVVKIYSINGVLLYRAENRKKLDIAFLPQGLYLLQVNTDNGSAVFRFFKE